MRTVREISSGGIVYRKRKGATEVAVIRVRDRWCLPKGQVEEGESVQETALREVKEETGLEGDVVTKLGDITYWYRNKTLSGEPVRIFKRVYFFLIRFRKGDVEMHDHEVDEVRWFPIDAAESQLAYPTERDVLRKAAALLKKKGTEKASSTPLSKADGA